MNQDFINKIAKGLRQTGYSDTVKSEAYSDSHEEIKPTLIVGENGTVTESEIRKAAKGYLNIPVHDILKAKDDGIELSTLIKYFNVKYK